MHLVVVIFIAALAMLLAVSFGVIDAMHVQPRPRAGQKRIVARLEELLPLCERLK